MADNLQRVGIELVAEDGGFVKNAKEAQKVIDKLVQSMKEGSLQGTKFEASLEGLSNDSRGTANDLKKAATSVKDLATATSKGTNAADKYTNKQKDLANSIKLNEALIEQMKIEWKGLNSQLAKDETGQVAARMKQLEAQISKAEVEIDTFSDTLRKNGAEYDRMTGDVEKLTAAERALQNVKTLTEQSYNRDTLVKEKYNIKLEQQAFLSEKLADAVEEERLQIARLSQVANRDEAVIRERTNSLAKLEGQLKASRVQEKAYADSVNALTKTNVVQLQRQKDAFRAIEEQGQGIRDIGFTIKDAGLALSAFITVPFAAGMAASTVAAIEFESSFTGILKTVDGAVRAGTLSELTEQGEQLRQAMLDLALQIPATTSELNLVGERAGQLGVAAKDIAEFTRIVVEFGEATDVTSEDASKAFAQVFNVFKDNLDGTDIVDFSDAASNAIVELGNNFATTESEILHFFQTFAGGAAAFDVAAEDALAIATAFKSVRAQTASSSTGIQKTFLNMSTAVQEGNKQLYDFAEISGLTAEQFAAQWESRPAVAFQKFLAGLSEAGGEAPNILRQLGLGDVRIQREFLKAAGGAQVLAEALEISAAAFGNFGAQGARAEEAARRFATTESQLKLLKNEFANLAITIGSTFIPAIKDFVTSIRPMVEGITELVEKNPDILKLVAGLGALAATIGPLAVVSGNFIATIGGFKAGIGSLNLGAAALLLAGEKNDEALKASINSATTFRGTLNTLSGALGVSTKALIGWGAVAGVTMAVAAAAVAYVAKEVRETNKALQEMVTTTDTAVDSISQLSKRQIELLDTIVQASNDYEDYSAAIKIAGFNTGELTEAQYRLIRANGESATELDKATEVIKVYAEELGKANILALAFGDFGGPTSDAIDIIGESTGGLEDYTDAIIKFKEASQDANKYSDFIRGPEVLQGGEAAKAVIEGLTDRSSDATVVAAALTEIYGGEAEAVGALGEAYGVTLEVTQQYLTNGKDLSAVIEDTIQKNEEQELALRHTVRAVQELTGSLSTAELEMVSFGHSVGESNEIIVRTIKTQRIMAKGALEAADAYAALQTGVEGVISFQRALSEAGPQGGVVGDIFAEGTEDSIASIQALEAAWLKFQDILEGTTEGDLADVLIEITENTQALKNEFFEAAVAAERAKLEATGFTEVEIEEHIAGYANSLGLLTDAQASATLELVRLRSEAELLITAFAGSELSQKQQAAALELLAGGYAETAHEAYTLVLADERIVDAALAAGDAVELQAADLEAASIAAREAAQAFIAAADAQDKIASSAKSGIRQLFETTATSAGTAATQVKKSVDDMSQSYVGFIDKVKDGEQPIENWGKLLLDSSVKAGASLEQIVALTIATGELSDEQAKGLLNQVAAVKAVEGIADAYVSGSLTADQAAAAVKGMQEQIEAGGTIDLSSYGVYLNKVEDVAAASGGAAKEVKTAQDVLRDSVIEIAGTIDSLSDIDIRDLEVQFGIISIDQADAENKYQNALDAMRLAFGTTFVDGVPTEFGLNILGIENYDQYFNEIYELAQTGADAAGAIELVIGVSADLGLSELDTKAFYDDVTAGLADDPEKSAIEVTTDVILKQGIVTDADLGTEFTQELANLSDRGIEVQTSYKDQGLQEYLTGIVEDTKTIAGEEVVHNAIFKSNINEEGGPAPEVIQLKALIEEVAGDNVTWPVIVEKESIFNATDQAGKLLGKLDAIAGLGTIDVKIKITQVGTTDLDLPGGGTSPDADNNYHGGLLRGKLGRDKFLSWVSNGEFIMPNYITNKPGVLDALNKMKSSGGAWTPTVGQQRLTANASNGVVNNTTSDNSVRRSKNVTINIGGNNKGNTRSKLLAFTNLNRV